MSLEEKREIVSQESELSIRRKCELVGLNRSSYYYQKKPEKDENIELMREIDRIYMERPYFGSRRMVVVLRKKGYKVGRKRVRRLMRLMGIKVLYPRPKNTSKRRRDHKIYPYLLKDLEIKRANQVWCSDITYIPLERGYLYLTVVMDWYSRKILSWKLSRELKAYFCREALLEAIEKHGKPEIFNTDQGSQYTSGAFIEELEGRGIRISMDGRGRWQDNRMVERFWRTIKYECVYLEEFSGEEEAKEKIRGWIRFYNEERPHFSFDMRTPDEVYYGFGGEALAA